MRLNVDSCWVFPKKKPTITAQVSPQAYTIISLRLQFFWTRFAHHKLDLYIIPIYSHLCLWEIIEICADFSFEKNNPLITYGSSQA